MSTEIYRLINIENQNKPAPAVGLAYIFTNAL